MVLVVLVTGISNHNIVGQVIILVRITGAPIRGIIIILFERPRHGHFINQLLDLVAYVFFERVEREVEPINIALAEGIWLESLLLPRVRPIVGLSRSRHQRHRL